MNPDTLIAQRLPHIEKRKKYDIICINSRACAFNENARIACAYGGLLMSEYADIVIKKLSLISFRNYLDSDVVNLFFSKKDLVVTPNYKIDSEDGESDNYTQYVYKTTVKKAKERLDARGFSISNLDKIFNTTLLQAIDYSEFLYHLGVDFEEREEIALERCKKKVSFRKWKNAMHKIISYELENGNLSWHNSIPELDICTECEKIIYYSLNGTDAESFYGIFTEFIHVAYIFRLILESCDDSDDIVLDFSYLQFWDDDCIPKALSATDDVEKTIVLVEGTSDKDILEFSIKQIYPHLSDLFYFMDFNDANGGKRDGGTSFVIKNLKTFYFSKLKSKFIAIFDNDAEGYSSKCALLNEIKNWPDNFRILLYPDIKMFHKYPTLAPNGTLMLDDISRKACSIELYLPDNLIKDNGSYFPIEWETRKKIKNENGYEESLYQGTISQKDDIKERFHQLRKEIENGKKTFLHEEWARMKQLLDTIVFAFVKE